ncbi:hypothetical protein T12_8163 [Trichinella patagoniensis]|uniref:Uncharacterized protein n=1 Tax=Trichinella patagoniensis TaxID=990121 RepID=A0A0V1AA62_9BILA|nr:hypothetical protein T12_8163 [Trichinella patagoniensis]
MCPTDEIGMKKVEKDLNDCTSNFSMLKDKQASNRRSRSESGFFQDFQGPTVRTLSLRIELALYHRSLFSIVINELPDAPASITSDRRQSN